ncbi:uncharacterized protein G2W53_030126 [Senna tora]|uniref:Uncharacterized protein n=1 Tax=Senna tora TaxID=362788 RepID=A0A834WBC5_9FABA|nr:uncharacterized protein G2W53_030126 [Senna tora]
MASKRSTQIFYITNDNPKVMSGVTTTRGQVNCLHTVRVYFNSQKAFINRKVQPMFDGRHFDDATLQVLQSHLVSKDVKSLMQVRSSFTEFLRSESLSVIRSIASKTVQEKLFILDFFVRAFAIIGDVESCLALRYEALVMRKFKSASSQWLEVSSAEWLNFVEDALYNGFHSIAQKACEHALSRPGKNDVLEPETDMSENVDAIRTISRLKNSAMASVSSRSGASGRVPKKKSRTGENELDLRTKTMFSKHFV